MNQLVVNKNDIINNINIIKGINSSNSKIIAVVKGNGMGLGLVKYTKFLEEQGIDMFAVATPEEALELIENDIRSDILLMTPVYDIDILIRLISNNIILTISNEEQIEIIEKLDVSNVNSHIKIDSGFARYGFLFDEKEKILECINKSTKIKFNRYIYSFLQANG